MTPPKRDLALTGAGAGAGREAAKRRLRLGVFTGASASASAAGWPVTPASPGKRMMRRSVLVVLFLLRMNDTSMTMSQRISQSQIVRMLQKLQKDQALMMSKFESKLESKLDKMDGRLENLEEKMEGVILEVKKSSRLLSNRHTDQQPRQEPYQESGTASGSNARNTHLRFLNGPNLKTPIYTEKKITSESNSAIRIGIFDADNKMIREGPLSKVKVEMLVLRGDFCSDGRESWTEEEFNSHVVQGRHGQGFVLGGDCSVWLNNGEASFGGTVRFKEGSSRTRSRKFIVAARVCIDGKVADRVREAVMKPVTVLDRRNEANEKRHPPELDDEVYRLEEISKDGTYRKRLNDAQIYTVRDFLKALNKDANKLRGEILRIKRHSSSWEKMVKHARECCLTDMHDLKAYQNIEGNVVIFLNCVHDLVGAKFDGVYTAQENFDPAKKALAYELKECARDQLDSLPFNYVMNGHLPEQVPSSTRSSLGAAILAPDEALEVHGNQLYDGMINHVVHGDQNTVNTQYYNQGEGIPPLSQQQPIAFSTPPQWDGELLDWILEGQACIHSQMQVPMPMDGGSAMEASTSVQNSVLQQPSVTEPSTWHGDRLPGAEPSDYPFQGPGYERF
ncbi:calmodulin-binding protein 60 C [Lolium perenne]|uniref:calmodulin-binding protein 60 C n=1 Tax=Lolium perenne TaxID=4522 RepID=UPI003A993074